MADTLESIEIEVKHEAVGAEAEINNLAQAVKDLGSALKSAMPQLRKFAANLSAIQTRNINIKNKTLNIGGAAVGGKKSAGGSAAKAPVSYGEAFQKRIEEQDRGWLNNIRSVMDVEAPAKTAAASIERVGTSARKSSKNVDLFGAALKALKQTFNLVGKGIKLVGKGFSALGERIKSSVAPLKTFIASMKRIMFYRIIRSIIKEIGAAFKEGLENAYLFSKGLSDEIDGRISRALDRLTSSSLKMKNQLGAAFGSMITAITPILVQLIGWVTKAAEAVTQLFAAFTGGTYLKAKDVSAEFADNSEKGAKATKEWKNQLLGFDEINRLEEPSDSGNGKNNDNSVLPSDMFEVQQIDQKIKDFVKSIKDAIKAGDWEGLGKMLAQKVNDAFASVDWKKLGNKVGNAINGVITTAYHFLKNVNFKAIGADIATFINSAIDKIDFTTAGRLFTRKITALFDLIIGFIMNLDWGKVAKSIGDFLKGAFAEAAEWLATTDIAAVARRLSDGVMRILNAILDAVQKAPWKEIGKAIGDFLGNIDWIGIFKTVAEIIWTAAKGLIEGLLDSKNGKIILAIAAGIAAIKALFAVAPIISAIGKFVGAITGSAALGGLAPAVGGIVSAVGAALAPLAAVIFSPTGLIVMAVIAAVVLIIKNWDKLVDAAGKLKDSLSKKWSEIKKGTSEAWSGIKDATAKRWEEIKSSVSSKVSEIHSHVKSSFSGIRDAVTQAWSNINSSTSQNWNNIKSTVINSWNSLRSSLQSGTSGFSSIGSSLVNSIRSGITSSWGSITSTLSGKLNELKNNISSSVSSAISSARSQVSNMTSSVWNSLNSLQSSASSIVSSIQSRISSALSSASSYLSGYSTQATKRTHYSSTGRYLGYYAGGGFPETGELYVARENGPELVGQIGSRNAVASNEDILEGIRRGVYDAVTAAMGNGSSSANDVSFKLYLDSREIKAGLRRLDRAAG